MQPSVEQRAQLFGMSIHPVTMGDAVVRVLQWCDRPQPDVCRYVVTPNVDHAVMYQHHNELRDAYAGASLVVADGAPIVWASRLLKQPLPQRVAGSDLVPSLFDEVCRRRMATNSQFHRLRVFLLGAAMGVGEAAALRIHECWPAIDVVGTHSPPLGFEHDPQQNGDICKVVANLRPDLLIVGLGAPKQELWIHKHTHNLHAKAAICAGATIDFLGMAKKRAPLWMQRAGLEWMYRAAREPRRLAMRYARDAWQFPPLVWRQWRSELR